jgi:hypothetical protein
LFVQRARQASRRTGGAGSDLAELKKMVKKFNKFMMSVVHDPRSDGTGAEGCLDKSSCV